MTAVPTDPLLQPFRLKRAGVRLTPDHRLREVRRGSHGLVAVLRNEYAAECVDRVVDQVVVEHRMLPNDDVFRLYRTGDAMVGRDIHAAMYDARRLVLSLCATSHPVVGNPMTPRKKGAVPS